MSNAFVTAIVIVLMTGIGVLFANRLPSTVRSLAFLAVLEYLLCATAQAVYARVIIGGGDTMLYSEGGLLLANMLDKSFAWASGEVVNILLQRPSALDTAVLGAGTNTGSMYAATAWLIFLCRGSDLAAQFVLTGLSMFAGFATFAAFRELNPAVSHRRLFLATVLFPSLAFWTAAFHKESFCVIGMSLCLQGWAGLMNRRVLRPLLLLPLGTAIILVFRAPVLPPLYLGFAAYFVFERFRRTRGASGVVILGPLYLAFALALLALAMVLVSRVAPSLSVEQIAETMAKKQATWARSKGGSAIEEEDFGSDLPAPSLGAQLVRVPVALFNALLRPQVFDVHNFGTLVSAVEMSVLTWLLYRAIRRYGLVTLSSRLQREPFVLMCTVTTLVGCAFVGLATLNLGSLARYRVPFLPFYATALACMLEGTPLIGRSRARLSSAPSGGLARPSLPASPAIAVKLDGDRTFPGGDGSSPNATHLRRPLPWRPRRGP